MGVHGLWNILAPVQEYRPLPELGGETLAVDLSIWVCGDISLKHNLSVATKLYLRNLFFRTLSLLRQNTLPVMVLDGVAPKLKLATMAKRSNSGKSTVTLRRSHFSKISHECCHLLDALGVPWVQSPGEAEAMCAFLNSADLVDSCITNDGDAFLYGAKKVYRYFSMDSRNPSVQVYKSTRVQTELRLSQNRLVFLGVLLGCDYWPAGVPGLGQANARRLLTSVNCWTDTEFTRFLHCLAEHRSCTEQMSQQFQCAPFQQMDCKLLCSWTKTALALRDCPLNEIFSEFLTPPQARSWTLPNSNRLRWKRPDPRALVHFCTSRLGWNPDYALHHLLPVLALWDIRQPQLVSAPKDFDDAVALVPIKIIKKRTVNYVPSYEIEWKRMPFDQWTSKRGLSSATKNGTLVPVTETTTELTDTYCFSLPITEFQKRYPHLCLLYEHEVSKKPMRRRKPEKNSVAVGDGTQLAIVDLFKKLSVSNPSETIEGMDRFVQIPCSNLPVAGKKQATLRWDSSSDSEPDCVPATGDRRIELTADISRTSDTPTPTTDRICIVASAFYTPKSCLPLISTGLRCGRFIRSMVISDCGLPQKSKVKRQMAFSEGNLWLQKEITLKRYSRGCHYVTDEIKRALPEIAQIKIGTLHLFTQHTSATLIVNESWDPSVKTDIEMLLNRMFPESLNYAHSCEGPDDMPAHAKHAFLGGPSLSLPVSQGKLALGTWQGIWLCEHRNSGSARRVIATLHGCPTAANK